MSDKEIYDALGFTNFWGSQQSAQSAQNVHDYGNRFAGLGEFFAQGPAANSMADLEQMENQRRTLGAERLRALREKLKSVEPKARSLHDDGQPCSGLGCGSSCPRFRARRDGMRTDMGLLPIIRPVCDPRCARGKPCRRAGCEQEAEAFRTLLSEQRQAARERTAEYRREPERSRLRPIDSFAGLSLRHGEWPYASRDPRVR